MEDRKCAGRLIAGVLCAGLAFWGFGTGPAAGILAYAGLTAYGAESEAGAETALLLHPTIRRYFRYASGQQSGEELLTRISYPEIHIPMEEARFSALSSALSQYNSEKKVSSLEALKTLTESAKEIHQDGNTDVFCSQECEAKIARADGIAFSIVENDSNYLGGAHGYYEKTEIGRAHV